MPDPAFELITGATGFIGRHLSLRLLQNGAQVRLLCRRGSEIKLAPELSRSEFRSRVEIATGDLLDRPSLAKAVQGVHRIFHCAGNVSDWGPPDQFQSVNVDGTRMLLEEARLAGVDRFVHLSSIAAFGTPAPAYFDDDSPLVPSRDPYSRTKAQGEKAVFDFHAETNFPVTVLRPAVVYGETGSWFEEPLEMIEKGKMFLLGGGKGTCHPCYIENLLDAMILASHHERAIGQGYIVADDNPITFREYFNSLCFVAGKGPIKRSIPLPAAQAIARICEGFARWTGTGTGAAMSRPLLTRTAIAMVTTPSRMSIQKIRNELGFQPRYTFHQAIQELKDIYQKRLPNSLDNAAGSVPFTRLR